MALPLIFIQIPFLNPDYFIVQGRGVRSVHFFFRQLHDYEPCSPAALRDTGRETHLAGHFRAFSGTGGEAGANPWLGFPGQTSFKNTTPRNVESVSNFFQ